MQQESGGRPGIKGSLTPYGTPIGSMQMLPNTARGVADKLGLPYRPDLLAGKTSEAAAYQNALGSAYLAEGYQKTGSLFDTFRYYHGGPNRKLWGPKTNAYAKQVMGRM